MRRDAGRRGGFTIMELMVVLAIIGLMMTGAVIGLRNILRSDLRSAASRTAAAMRYVFDRATMTGTYMRLTFDLDKGLVWPEYTEDKFTIRLGQDQYTHDMSKEEEATMKEEVEATIKRQERIKKWRKRRPGVPMFDLLAGGKESGKTDEEEAEDETGAGEGEEEDGTEEKPGIDAEELVWEWHEDMRPVERPRTSFKPLKSRVGKRIKLAPGIRIVDVMSPRLPGPITDGRAHVYFFPQGHAEPAVVHFEDSKGDAYSVVLHPLTGRARVYPCYYEVPEDFGLSDDQKKGARGGCREGD